MDKKLSLMRCRAAVTIVHLGLIPLLSGCAAASLATAGAVAGLAASVVTTGADVYHLGKLDSVDMGRQDELITAVRRASEELSLTIYAETWENEHSWYSRLKDDQGSTIGLTVDARTSNMCRVRINVGVFGSEPTARLFLIRLRENLPKVHQVRPKLASEPAISPDTREPAVEDRTVIRKPPRAP